MSLGEIDRLGIRLRERAATVQDRELLDRVRLSCFADFDWVYREALRLDFASFPVDVTTRLKTTNSIVEKLRRSPSMRLSQMQDIAGLRVVLPACLDEQSALAEELAEEFEGHKVRPLDRRSSPSNGYRALHLTITIDGRHFEVQIRTAWQHTWADVTEKIADLWGQQVKYGGEPEDPDKTVRGDWTRQGVVDHMAELSDLIFKMEMLRNASSRIPDDLVEERRFVVRSSKELEASIDRLIENVRSMCRLI